MPRYLIYLAAALAVVLFVLFGPDIRIGGEEASAGDDRQEQVVHRPYGWTADGSTPTPIPGKAPPVSQDQSKAEPTVRVISGTFPNVGVYPNHEVGAGCNYSCCEIIVCPEKKAEPVKTEPAKAPPSQGCVANCESKAPPSPPQTGPQCPAHPTHLGLPDIGWQDEAGDDDICKWQAHHTQVPEFVVPNGSQVDYDAAVTMGKVGFYVKACPGATVPAHNAVGSISVRFAFDNCPYGESYVIEIPATSSTQAASGIDKSPSGLAASIGLPSNCSLVQPLGSNGAQFRCSGSFSFTVPNGFVVVYGNNVKATAGQPVTAEIFSVYDER